MQFTGMQAANLRTWGLLGPAPRRSAAWKCGEVRSKRSASQQAPHRTRATLPTHPSGVEEVQLQAGQSTSAANEQLWKSFAAAVAGEWEGVTATFSPSGEAKPLPEYYVPEAYRDWGVVLTDWQSQSSVRADSGGLAAVHRRMMPTVGCEADAIAFTEEEQQLFEAGAGVTVAADGSYSVGALEVSDPGLFSTSFQHCLVLAQGQRLRLVHKLKRMGAQNCWKVAEVEMHRERWDGPWTGKLELSGCGGGMEPFAQTEPLDSAALDGNWLAAGVRHSIGASGQRASVAVHGDMWSLASLPAPPVYLPLGVWSSVAVDGDSISMAVGVLRDDGSMRLATRRLTAGGDAEVEILTLEKST